MVEIGNLSVEQIWVLTALVSGLGYLVIALWQSRRS